MTIHAISEMDLMSVHTVPINEEKLGHFLKKIQETYHLEVPYHNDMHGADVMHMVYYMMTKGNLSSIIHMREIDQLSMLIAAACHDLGHDGFTNSYHGNAIT